MSLFGFSSSVESLFSTCAYSSKYSFHRVYYCSTVSLKFDGSHHGLDHYPSSTMFNVVLHRSTREIIHLYLNASEERYHHRVSCFSSFHKKLYGIFAGRLSASATSCPCRMDMQSAFYGYGHCDKIPVLANIYRSTLNHH